MFLPNSEIWRRLRRHKWSLLSPPLCSELGIETSPSPCTPRLIYAGQRENPAWSMRRNFSRKRAINIMLFLGAAITILFFSKIAIARRLPLFEAPPVSRQRTHRSRLGAVTSLSARCSKVGIKMLESGGNAADAIIATEFCVGVIGMASTGLGGGGFALVRKSDGSYENVDFRETAPAAAFQDMYDTDDDLSIVGGLASGVPGVLRGLEYLHKSYARLSWEELIAPSIAIARKGFEVSQDLVDIFNQLDEGAFLIEDPAWAIDFAPNGTLLGVGDTITRKRYADLLEHISKHGPDAFYAGDVANATIRALQASNGTMTMDDLRDYTITLRSPLTIQYRDYKITSCGAPSSGAVVLSVLKTIEGYGSIGPQSINISTHRLDEAIRFGFGARTELGDPTFFPNITGFEESMITEATAETIRSKISDLTTLPVAAYDPKGIENAETHGTSHIVAADSSGMAISLTRLIMNNEMNDFSVPGVSNSFGFIPSPINYVAPRKRPQSSMSPTIIEFFSNRTLYYVLGGSGGSYIITSVLQCIWNVLDLNMTLAQALEEPRFHDQLVPDVIEFEYPYNNATTAFMGERNHVLTWSSRWSEVQALRRLSNGTFEAASEPSLVDSAGCTI